MSDTQTGTETETETETDTGYSGSRNEDESKRLERSMRLAELGTSLLSERAKLARQAGVPFDDKDLYKVFGYPRRVTQEHLWQAFSRQNIARRIVVAPAAASWFKPPKVVFDSSDAQTKWDDLISNKRLNVWFQLARLDVLCGMGDYAILFISMGDGNPSIRARRVVRRGEPLFMRPYSQMAAKIAEFDDNVGSENYGRPLMYEINPTNSFQVMNSTSGGSIGSTVGITSVVPQIVKNFKATRIHYTRVVHAAEEAFDNDVYGASRLRAVYNDLRDVLKIVGGAAEAFWLVGNRGLHIDVDKELELMSGDEDELQAEIDEYLHNLSRVIRTRGTKVTSLGSETPDPSKAFSATIALICGATTIPRRILMGSEAGHLASEQDRANWADRTRERNELFVKPRILYPFILRLQEMGLVPESDFEVDWPDPFTLSPIEQSQAFANFSRGLASTMKEYETGAILFTREEIREKAGLKPDGPEPGMGELPELDLDMFMPEENIQTARNRRPGVTETETGEIEEEDTTDVQGSATNPQIERG